MPTRSTYAEPGQYGLRPEAAWWIVHIQVTFVASAFLNTLTTCCHAATNTCGGYLLQEYHVPFISWPKPMITRCPKSRTLVAYWNSQRSSYLELWPPG